MRQELAQDTGPAKHIHTTRDNYLVLWRVNTNRAVIVHLVANKGGTIGMMRDNLFERHGGNVEGPKQFGNALMGQTLV